MHSWARLIRKCLLSTLFLTLSGWAALPWITLTSIQAITTGESHSCALLARGIVQCWGLNTVGQLGSGSTTAQPPQYPVLGLADAKQVVAGQTHACAIMADDTLRCWGGNSSGQLGDGSVNDRSSPVATLPGVHVTALAANYQNTCAVLAEPRLNVGVEIPPVS